MKIAVTGATGFLGREVVRNLSAGNELKCWTRGRIPDRGNDAVNWIRGELGDENASRELVSGCDALIHSAHWKPGSRFQGEEGDIVEYANRNVIGSLMLLKAAAAEKLKKIVIVSSGAVHDEILDDRTLDEAHPLWPNSHYGAHKASLEAFASSFARGHDVPVCVLRPTAIYGSDDPIEKSLWYDLIRDVALGKRVEATKARKVVHVADVARAIEILVHTDQINGQVYSCCDRSVSDYEVANIAKRVCGSGSVVGGLDRKSKHTISTGKLCGLGMEFGGDELLEANVREILATCTGERSSK